MKEITIRYNTNVKGDIVPSLFGGECSNYMTVSVTDFFRDNYGKKCIRVSEGVKVIKMVLRVGTPEQIDDLDKTLQEHSPLWHERFKILRGKTK